MEVKKAIIPAAGLGTRFLPLTKVFPKEFLPLVDRPMIEYTVRELKQADISQIIFVLSEHKKVFLDYFKKNCKIEKIIRKHKGKSWAAIHKEFEGLSFSSCLQTIPKGDGDAVLKARALIKKDNFAVIFPDDFFDSKIPAMAQLKKIFQTSQKPVIGLKKMSKDKISAYGAVAVEKIANKLYKIKAIVEKPAFDKTPSDLAITGRYILTPEIFPYLVKTKPDKKNEIILANALNDMIADGKQIYGYELEGEWLECGTKASWIKSNIHFLLKDPEYRTMIKEIIKK